MNFINQRKEMKKKKVEKEEITKDERDLDSLILPAANGGEEAEGR